MRIVLSCAAAILVALVAAGSSASRTASALRLVDRSPLVVRGESFRPFESVRIEVSGLAEATRRVFATRAGVFSVRFADVTATRCDQLRVVAIGGRGSRAGLKYLPAPACQVG